MHLSPAPWLALALVLPIVALAPPADAWMCNPDPLHACAFVQVYVSCAVGAVADGEVPCVVLVTVSLPVARVSVCIDDNGNPTVSEDETCTMDDNGVVLAP